MDLNWLAMEEEGLGYGLGEGRGGVRAHILGERLVTDLEILH